MADDLPADLQRALDTATNLWRTVDSMIGKVFTQPDGSLPAVTPLLRTLYGDWQDDARRLRDVYHETEQAIRPLLDELKRPGSSIVRLWVLRKPTAHEVVLELGKTMLKYLELPTPQTYDAGHWQEYALSLAVNKRAVAWPDEAQWNELQAHLEDEAHEAARRRAEWQRLRSEMESEELVRRGREAILATELAESLVPVGWQGERTTEPLTTLAEIAGYGRRELAGLGWSAERIGRGEFWIERAQELLENLHCALVAAKVANRPRPETPADDAKALNAQLGALVVDLERLAKHDAAQSGNSKAASPGPAVSALHEMANVLYGAGQPVQRSVLLRRVKRRRIWTTRAIERALNEHIAAGRFREEPHPKDATKAVIHAEPGLGLWLDQQDEAAANLAVVDLKEPKKKVRPKRSTEKGEAKAKLIAALSKHHKYADGGCLNMEPIGNNKLARDATVDQATASAFFKKRFKSHGNYKALCRDNVRLVTALKMLNDEFSPFLLFGDKPPGKGQRDDE